MAIQGLFTGEVKIRELNGVLIAANGVVDSVGNITSGTAGTSGSSGTSGTSGSAGTSGFAGTAGRLVNNFVATAGQTTFYIPSGYDNGMVDVFVNGVKLFPSDFTATDGFNVILNNPLKVGDNVEIDNFVSSYVSSSGSSGTAGTAGTSGTTGTSGIGGDKYYTISVSIFTLGTGGYLMVSPGLSYSPAQSIIVVHDNTHFQECEVVSYNVVTGELVFGDPIAQVQAVVLLQVGQAVLLALLVAQVALDQAAVAVHRVQVALVEAVALLARQEHLLLAEAVEQADHQVLRG